MRDKVALYKSMFMLLLSALSIGAVASSDSQQRKAFLQAEKKVWQSQSANYKQLYSQLYFYPLLPYLDQKRLLSQVKLSSKEEITEFLTKYQGTPLDWPLRKKWLNYLAKRNRQGLFIAAFRPTNDATLNCYHLRYQLNKGANKTSIFKQVTPLWTVGRSQPKACDPLFKQWSEAGYRTNDIVWQRLKLAAKGGKHTLIPYLTTLLPKEEQSLARTWHKVRRDPSYVAKLSRFKNKGIEEAEIYTYGIKRLIWRDADRALRSYKSAEKAFPFTRLQKNEITQRFALALASKHHKSAQKWLQQVDESMLTDAIIQWRIADALRRQDWLAIKSELASIPESRKSSLMWQYWYARSLIETNDREQGEAIFKTLAEKRHYYGFLAASSIGESFNLQENPLQISDAERKELFSYPAGKRAFEFFHLGRYHHARKEWNYWLSQLNDRQKLVASKMANEEQWFDRAIFTLANVGYLDDVDLRFPLAFDEDISRYADKQDINPAWAFAIARRESSFMADAHSSVGAKGLMQIMPKTAKQLDRRTRSNSYLLNTKNNIKLGTKYLKQLLDKYKGNNVLATASYNAGPYRVKKWLKNGVETPADIWIETIPYKETREYVKSVLAYQQIYQHKVGQKGALFDAIIQMTIKDK